RRGPAHSAASLFRGPVSRLPVAGTIAGGSRFGGSRGGDLIMAFPASFEESDACLGRPPNMTDDECAPLSIARAGCGGIPTVVSCWKLTAEELAEVNRTGRVWLGICGVTMPPALISGCSPFKGS